VENAVSVYNHIYIKYKPNTNKPQRSTDNNETRCDAAASAQTAQDDVSSAHLSGTDNSRELAAEKNGLLEGGDRLSENCL
jgi:hypothetical protein